MWRSRRACRSPRFPVLSGKGRISPTTVEKVNQAIEQLGYVRNRRGGDAARRGVRGDWPYSARHLRTLLCRNDRWAERSAGGARQAAVFDAERARRPGLQRAFDALLAQGVDGIVLAGGIRAAAGLKEKAAEQGVPLVCVARSSGLDGVDVVRPDNMQAAKLATEFLIKRGHSQIAYLGGQSDSLTRAERLGGFCATPCSTACRFAANGSSSAIAGSARRRKRRNNCCAITRTLPPSSATRRRWRSAPILAERSGRSIGSDGVDAYYGRQVALIGFGDVPEAELTEPPLTFVSSSAREVGRSAAARLLQRIGDADLPAQNVILPPTLIRRGSA